MNTHLGRVVLALDGEKAPKQILIDGKWRAAASGKTFKSINPASGQCIAEIADGDKQDIDLAVEAARKAFGGAWAKFTPFERQEVLLRLADLVEHRYDEIAALDTLDMGAPISRTLLGRRRTVGLLRFYAGLATTISGRSAPNSIAGNPLTFTIKEPVGVVGVITAWNGPFPGAVWKVAPALATGCTVVLKPAEEASLSALVLGQLCAEAGVPDGVINVVTGGGEAGAALAGHPHVDKITFTGSTETGQKIVQASAGNLKRLSLELGGKSPNIVFADADLDAAAPGAAMAVFLNSGQVCTAGTRLYVQQEIHDEFVARMVSFTKTLKVGDPTVLETQLGPLASGAQLERVTGYLSKGKSEGARVEVGGDRMTTDPHAAGYYVAPTIFSGVAQSMSIAREEIFGPVISVLPFKDADDVIPKANDTNFGLAAGVWSKNIDNATKVARTLRAGTVWINTYSVLDPGVPFGGYKMSGYGREFGTEHVEEYLNTKSIWFA